MSGKKSAATRKTPENTCSPAVQTTLEKIFDHQDQQRQTSHQTQAPPTETALGSHFQK